MAANLNAGAPDPGVASPAEQRAVYLEALGRERAGYEARAGKTPELAEKMKPRLKAVDAEISRVKKAQKAAGDHVEQAVVEAENAEQAVAPKGE
jgi:hypothetical protein